MDLTILAIVAAAFMVFGAWVWNKVLIRELAEQKNIVDQLERRNKILKAWANGLTHANNDVMDDLFKQGFEAGKSAKIREIGISMLSDSYVLKNGSIASPKENFYRPAKLGPKG